MKLAAMMDIKPGEFWLLTPRELFVFYEGYKLRIEAEISRETRASWLVASLSRQKRIPKLRSLLAPLSSKKRKPKSKAKVIAERDYLVSLYNQRIKGTTGPAPAGSKKSEGKAEGK